MPKLENLEEGDIVLCTVDRIIGTIVFVKIHLDNKEKEGSIVFSEIAPGRIRNIRDYVVPKKKIVCKILRISPSKDRIDLSLRRVSQKEKKELIDRYKQEKSYENILKSILKEKTSEIIEKIKEKDNLYDFIEDSKSNSEKLEKLVRKENTKKILEIINTQKKKKAIIKKIFYLTSNNEKGLEDIKEILSKTKEIEIKYISAGKYSAKIQAEEIKKADLILKQELANIEKLAKNKGMDFKISEK